ncbi:MAG: NADH-quinone oxidoreductase subunit G [Gammaproteobacteria bacterium]|nr:NADH-quinone oxidoreductase subunit G [Gammaproteobacteria bacterium]
MVNIEIDGVKLEAEPGSMLIEAADKAGIKIPRFCYHKKLSVAANCRMCLVEVAKAPKALPACATPVNEGMVVFTASERARVAQKSVMEFLLINHPLDCPICDQGGECELQDISVGYGKDVSRFTEGKRAVRDKDIGPLVATDMTRCIHCTRCVRFGTEIAGMREMGATGRGEHMEIGTFIEKSVDSEVSGNIIDLCPVGALTSKPFRFSARAWELNQADSVAPHDCLGTNVHVHQRRSQVMRVVPRENEGINEVWISDRDRFAYEALNGKNRLTQPMLKRDGQWVETDWQTALEHVANSLKAIPAEQLGALVSPNATAEEAYLAAKLMRDLGSNNVDHRLRRADVSTQNAEGLFPALGLAIAELENLDACLLVGSNLRKEVPLAALRLRKATRNGKIAVVNPAEFDFNFKIAEHIVADGLNLAAELAGIAKALVTDPAALAADAAEALANVVPTAAQAHAAELLKAGEKKAVILGHLAQNHPAYGQILGLAQLIASLSGASCGVLTEGANSAGATIAGAVPHRAAGGRSLVKPGLAAKDMLSAGLKAFVLMSVEPELDSADGAAALKALNNAEFVVSLSAFNDGAARDYADVLLPVAAFTETSGSFVNVEGLWQSFAAVVPAKGEARPAWKVLRVLGNLLNLKGYDYVSSEDVAAELKALADSATVHAGSIKLAAVNGAGEGLVRLGEVPLYAADALVRRAPALNKTADAATAVAGLAPALAAQLGVADGDKVRVRQGEAQVELPVNVDDRLPAKTVLVSSQAALGSLFGALSVEKA